MSFNWINPENFSFNCFTLMDRYLLRSICMSSNIKFRENFGIALAANPVVAWYCKEKAPEVYGDIEEMVASAPANITPEAVQAAENFVLDACDWAVVYMYPEVMNKNCSYIYGWDKVRLFELANFDGMLVLDVGAGSGRLTFAAAERAKYVYASEPIDRLREFMRDKIKREDLTNIVVLDGMADWLPFEENFFDIVMFGYVPFGDCHDNQISELMRVIKPGGWLLNCPGEEDRKLDPDKELLKRNWEQLHYISKFGGDVYRYRKQIRKK